MTVTPARVRRARRRHRTYVVTHTRSRKHSLEIIGGSAAGGALIGGGAGFVYDRLTRKKKRLVTR